MKTLVGAVRFIAAAFHSILFASLILMTLVFTRNSRVFHWWCRKWAGLALKIGGVAVSVRGAEHLLEGRSFVYVSNHASVFDIPAVIAAIPDEIRIVYKKELEKIPIFGWGLKYGSYIGIDRGRGVEAQKSLEEAIEKIRRGESVLLFAEGTRTLDGRLQTFKRGAFHIAARAGVPVVPLTINGSFRILPKNSIAVQPGAVQLILEQPIYLKGKDGKEAERELMEKVHAAIEKHYINQ